MKKELMRNKLVKEEVKHNGYWVQFKKRCPVCDCTNYMRPNADMMLCKVCGTKIFRDDKTKFKYELGRRLKR